MRTHAFFALALTGLLIAACKQEPDAPEVTPVVDINDMSLSEGSGAAKLTFTVSLADIGTGTVVVTYTTKDGTAQAGSDYVAASGTVSFAPGELTKAIEITLIGDTLREQNETFTVELTGAQKGILGDTKGTGTIVNDDNYFIIDDAGYTTPTSYPGKTLVWSDEFNTTGVNTADWTYELGTGCPNLCGWGNNELQYYTARKENAYQTQGKLVIEARKENYGGSGYTSTRIISRNKRFFQFGRIDFRAKLPEGQGIWPAFWMLSNGTTPWPKGGEIDIMELVGHQPGTVHGTVHYGNASNQQKSISKSYSLSGKKFSGEFHVFSIDWKEDTIAFLMDDIRYSLITRSTVEASGGIYPFNAPFFFIMNIAVGGNWPGNPNATTVFPQNMVVDYVRVFQ